MIFKHCPDCGENLDSKEIGDEGFVPFCSPCQKPLFSFSYPCVLCVITNDKNEIALIKQSYVSEHWVGVAGYVKQGETIENCAKREVEEETGLTVTEVDYLKSYYLEKEDLLMFGFICKTQTVAFSTSKEVEQARWFPVGEALNSLKPGSIIQTLVKDYMHDRKYEEEAILRCHGTNLD